MLETPFMSWSIRYRLFIPLGLLLLGVVGISIWSAYASARHAEERIARHVRGVTQTIAGASINITQPILAQMKGLSGADYLLIDANGQRMATFPDASLHLPDEIVSQPAEEGNSERLGSPIEIQGEKFRCRRLPLRAGGNLFIFYPESSLNEAIRDAVRPSLVFGLFGGLAAVGLMLGIAQRLVSRIRELERHTRRIAAGDFSPMNLPRQRDELRDLSRSVNEMAGKLAQLQEAVRKSEQLRLIGQLSNGLAHQLRNAVTGAKLAVQLHASECATADDEAIQVALRQMALMEANLRRFMDLGKPETQAPERCSIPEIIEEILLLVRKRCDHAGVALYWERPEAAIDVQGDRAQLLDLLLNVITNAIEAATKGIVEIRLQIRQEPEPRVYVDVIDSGPGPPPEIAARLFEPFVTGKSEGIGLGLAVAIHAAEAHGGSIIWSRDANETLFRIVLPALTH